MAENASPFNSGSPFSSETPAFGSPVTSDASRLAALVSQKKQLEAILSNPKIPTDSLQFIDAKNKLASLNAEIKKVKASIASASKKPAAKKKTAAEQAAESARSTEWLAQQEAAAKQRMQQQAQSAREEAARQEALGNTQKAAQLRSEAANIESPKVATPTGETEAAGQPAGKDWSHGLKVPKGKILWQNADGSWSNKQSAVSISEAIRKDKNTATRVRNLLIENGYNPKDFTGADALNNVIAAWGEFAGKASQAGVSPFDYKEWAAENLPEWAQQGAAGGGAGGAGGGGTTQQYYKTVQTPQGLRADVDKLYQATLGRNATWKEVVDATNFVNTQIDKNPYTVKQTAAGRTESGLTQGAVLSMLEQRIKKQPEYAEQVGQNFESWVEQKTGLKFATIANDPGIDAALRLYKAGNEADALRALKNTQTIKSAEASGLAGKTATARNTLAEYATAMGVAFDVDAAAKTIADGLASEDDYKNQIKELAKSYFPSWAKQIDSGLTMQSIAYPYLNSMTQILELNPAEVNVNDPMIKRALTFRDKDGNATSQSIWDFEQSLRQDPRWAYTKNARNELDSVARSVLRDFGLAY